MSLLHVNNNGRWFLFKGNGNGLTKNNIIKYSAHNRETFIGLLDAKHNGYDFSECDVADNCFTTDGVPMVSHEATFAGLTIANETLATLKAETASTIVGIGRVSIPTLAEYLQLTRLLCIDTIIDTKSTRNTTHIETIIEVINRYANTERLVILTASVAATELFAKGCPNAHVYWLAVPTTVENVESIAAFKQYNTHLGFSINAYGLSDTTFAPIDSAIKKNGLEIGFWNAAPSNYSQLANYNPYYMGFDASMSDIKAAEKAWLNSLSLFG